MILFALELDGFGQLLPFAAFGWDFEGAAFFLLEYKDGIVLAGEGSGEVFAAIIVDERQMGLVAFDGGGCDEPCEGIVLLTQEARNLAEEILTRN